VHALIIGISDYPHLDGGVGKPASATGGMGQLEVCALTAARVFDWLKSRDRVAGVPVASCRLQLAPRPGEQKDVTELTGSWYDDAAFNSLRVAMEAWAEDLGTAAGNPQPTVAFLFFSGHGLEHISEPSLLARDILNPLSKRGRRNALSFNSLWQSVRTYGIDRALFFIDACRNDPELAKILHIVGEKVLEPDIYAGKPPDAVVWLQSTRSGAFSYQLPGTPATIFGQGLLEALEGLPPDHVPYDKQVNPWRLIFRNLESHVKQRVRDLLAQHSATKIQLVEPGGYPYDGDTLVAEKTPSIGVGVLPAGPPPAEPPPPELPPTGLEAMMGAGAIDITTHDLITLRSNTILKPFKTVPAATFIAFRNRAPMAERAELIGDLGDYALMHEVFGHEHITEPWVETLRILDVDRGTPVPTRTVTISEAQSQEANGRLTAWVDVEVDPGAGEAVWIQSGGDRGQPSLAVAVPRDLHSPIPVRLDLTFRAVPNDWKWALETMTARLAPPSTHSSNAQRIWGPLWEIQRIEALADLSSASLATSKLQVLEAALEDKMASPVAAAVSAALLLRAGALEALHDWPQNLANGFPWLADGPILWAEALIRRDENSRSILTANPQVGKRKRARSRSKKHRAERVQLLRSMASQPNQVEARRYFMEMVDRGPPLLTSVLAMAARQAVQWRLVIDAEGVDGDDRHRLEAACNTIERAATHAVSDGLFTAFISHDANLMPHDVIGVRQRASMQSLESMTV
jgi:hypothetical protein